MKPRPRIRKTIKWGGAVVTALLAVAWIGSGWWSLAWTRKNEAHITFLAGHLVVLTGSCRATNENVGWHLQRAGAWYPWNPSWGTNGQNVRAVWIPVCIPLAVSLAATLAAWRLDTLARRRAKLNLCPKCGYDRAGLRDGINATCPECGTVPASV